MRKQRKKERKQPQSNRSVPASRSVTIMLATVLLALGAGIALLCVRMSMPKDLESQASSSQVEVETTVFDDRRPVTFRVAQGTDASLNVPVDGTVTGYHCATGEKLNSGTSILAINGTPVLSLSTSVPLYRTLSNGTKGADVTALHDELRRLGFDAPQSDTFDWQSVQAFNALAQRVGSRQASADNNWSITPDMIMWQPEQSAIIASCPLRTGVTANPQTTAITLEPRLIGIDIISASNTKNSQPSAGARTVTIGSEQFTIADSTAHLDDPAILDAVRTSREYRSATSSNTPASPDSSSQAKPGQLDVTYQWALAEPLQAFSVPPSALYDVSAGEACVVNNGEARAVQLLASQLGTSIVHAQGGEALHSVEVPPASREPCR